MFPGGFYGGTTPARPTDGSLASLYSSLQNIRTFSLMLLKSLMGGGRIPRVAPTGRR
jgi:hypothetical protein